MEHSTRYQAPSPNTYTKERAGVGAGGRETGRQRWRHRDSEIREE